VNARHLFQRAIQFKPSWSVFLATNHRPEMPDDDIALWERVKLIPFDVRISDEQKDTGLKEKLSEEGSGILAWLVRGAMAYLESGLEDPEAVTISTAEYQAESDPVGDFIGKYLSVHSGDDRYYVPASELRAAWYGYQVEFEEADGVKHTELTKPLKSEHGKRLIASKSKKLAGSSIRVWYGFSLNDEGDALIDEYAESTYSIN
jgi:putative DNA primase/helicase